MPDLEIPSDQHRSGGAEPAWKRWLLSGWDGEVFNAFLVIMRLPLTAKSVAAKNIAQMVGGVHYFVIGIALLIFGYGICELVTSGLKPRLEVGEEQHTSILSVNSLQSLTTICPK